MRRNEGLSTGGDFAWTGTLAAGSYEIALGALENMSFAEQQPGVCTLADGFIGLGDPGSPGYGSCSLTLTTPVTESSGRGPVALGLGVAAARKWRAARRLNGRLAAPPLSPSRGTRTPR